MQNSIRLMIRFLFIIAKVELKNLKRGVWIMCRKGILQFFLHKVVDKGEIVVVDFIKKKLMMGIVSSVNVSLIIQFIFREFIDIPSWIRWFGGRKKRWKSFFVVTVSCGSLKTPMQSIRSRIRYFPTFHFSFRGNGAFFLCKPFF